MGKGIGRPMLKSQRSEISCKTLKSSMMKWWCLGICSSYLLLWNKLLPKCSVLWHNCFIVCHIFMDQGCAQNAAESWYRKYCIRKYKHESFTLSQLRFNFRHCMVPWRDINKCGFRWVSLHEVLGPLYLVFCGIHMVVEPFTTPKPGLPKR